MMTIAVDIAPPAIAFRETSLTRQKMDDGIQGLRNDLVRMTDLTRGMVADAMIALKTGDTKLAQSIIDRDALVDTLDQSIEVHAIRLVATQQPVAYDLRFIGTALKVTTDIERVGDHAVNIARTVQRLALAGGSGQVPLEIERMGVLAQEQIGHCAEAYMTDDVKLAKQVVDRDDEMDVLYRESQWELRARMRDTPADSVSASHLLFVAHYLERIGDHCANAAERLDFLRTGHLLHS